MSPDEIGKAIKAVFPWITDGTSAVMVLMLLGRGLKALREGHGIIGWWRSIVYGSSYNPGNKPDDGQSKP